MKILSNAVAACVIVTSCTLVSSQACAEPNSNTTETVDFVQLTKNPREWPPEVALTAKLTWPVFVKEQRAGTMELPIGMKLKLVKVQGNRITVALGETVQIIPATLTDLGDRVLALRQAAALQAQNATPMTSPAPSETQPPPASVSRNALRSNLPSGVRFVIMSEARSYEPFAPFEPLKFRLTFDAPDSWQNVQRYGKFSVSGRSTINGRLFPKPFVDNLRTQFATDDSKRLSFEWVPVRDLIPPQTGKYNIQVVLDTPTGKWITPLTTVEVSLPEADRASLKFLAEKGGGDFFSREIVLRTRSEGHLRPPPYPVIKDFIKTFPDSSLNTLIVRQAEHARRHDASQGPNYYLPQDREQLAEIIALAHPSMVQELETTRSSYEQRVEATVDRHQKQLDQKEIEGINRWIALLTKYTQ